MLLRALVPLLLAVGLAAACGSSGRDDLEATRTRDGGSAVNLEGGGAFIDASTDGGTRVCLPDSLDQEGCSCPSADTTRECYKGAPQTRKVGVCFDGTQKCEKKGEFLSWGACIGGQMPNKESCGSIVDINCNGKVGCEDPQCATDPECDTPCTDGEERPCYEGNAGTENVGACKNGVQKCIDGHWTKSCTGQVLPGSEQGNCNDGLDNDCNGLKDCQDAACLFDFHCIFGCEQGQTQSCYEGPVGTEGVAQCHGGQRNCKPDGSGFGACEGQVLPGSEAANCNDGVDNDCDGVKDCDDPACVTTLACCTNNPSPADGTIWANSPTTLYRVDPNTFAVTTVGTFNAGESITDLALTPNGVLYAVSFTKIYEVNKANASVTPVVTLAGTGNDGMTFLPNGNLLAGDANGDVKQINPSTGAFSTIGNYGNGLGTAGDLVAVANGKMYATSRYAPGGSDATSNNYLIQVNSQTGSAVPIGPTGYANIWGIAYANGNVIGFNTAGQILKINVASGQAQVMVTKNIEFWGATQSPLVDANLCP